MAEPESAASGSDARRVAGSGLRMQRVMLVGVLAVGAILPVSVLVFSRSAQSVLGAEVGSSIDAFEVYDGRPLVAGPVSTQVCSGGSGERRIDSLDGDEVVVLAHAADRAFALTERGLFVADPLTLSFASWPGQLTPRVGQLREGTGLAGLRAMGAANDVVYTVSDAGRTSRLDSETAEVLSSSASRVEAPRGRLAVAAGSSPTVWGVNNAGRLVRSDDDGGSWIEVANRGSVVDVAADDAAPSLVGVLDEDGVELSNDAGLTWDRIDSPPGLEAIAFDASVLYAATAVDGRCLTFAFVDEEWTTTP